MVAVPGDLGILAAEIRRLRLLVGERPGRLRRRLHAERESIGERWLAAGEHVLDVGCGTGRLTAELVSRLPRGRLIAIDRSWNMLLTARAFNERLTLSGVVLTTAGSDYVALPGAVTIDAGASAATIAVTPIDGREPS